jgi:hypothetical protein
VGLGVRALSPRSAASSSAWQPATPPGACRRIHGELALPGIKIAPSTVREILTTDGAGPAPQQTTLTWAGFPRSQAEAILAMDFTGTIPSPEGASTSSPPSPHRQARPHSRHHHPPHTRLGYPGRPHPAHGPKGRRKPPAGQVPHPRPRRHLPRADRQDPQRRHDHHCAGRCPDAPHEPDHRTLGEHAPRRTAGPHADLEPDPPPARAPRLRAALQPAPHPPPPPRQHPPGSCPTKPTGSNASPYADTTASAE